jgi:cytochrome c peroxidase
MSTLSLYLRTCRDREAGRLAYEPPDRGNARSRGLLCLTFLAFAVTTQACREAPTTPRQHPDADGRGLDDRLRFMLEDRSFTGRIEETLETRLGREVDDALAELGRALFFDPILSLTGDNSCSGCHGPNVGFNGSKSIAIGVYNNGIVGPGRNGPRNIRRAPTLLNAAFLPRLMWDSRFSAASLDPFDNTSGFDFPEPEGGSLSHLPHLLTAQAFTPVVAREEMAGFTFRGDHDAMRGEIARRVDAVPAYRDGFEASFPELVAGQPISFGHIAQALAEFQFTLIRADAPIDAYARGDDDALTDDQKRGAILFFGRAMCGECHIVRGYANEMFSDFETHVLAVPQLVPTTTNVTYDGPGANEDFGVERFSGDPDDRYRFRTSPLRNVGLQPSFMHNGAYLCLDEAIRHHVRIRETLDAYDAERLAPDLRGPRGPLAPALALLHDLVDDPPPLTDTEIDQIVDFVGHGLTDRDARPDRLRALIPESVPGGLPVHDFELDIVRPECG